ncbi:Exopolysaccharide production negative regulator [Gossypium australe]|uniref:Exopolysaccharide production negative regulator n=1 Tax=Gossypium australe TaxID=47621 RepID=A0A5B6VJE8_9ROSI|nr:Exopolysaccharide production negative regulator [Gossypium australe]
MDSQELPDNGNKGFRYMLLRIAFALLFPIFVLFLLSFLVCLLAIFMGELSISDPISVPTQCKIVSSSVDIRSSKVCELGLLNYKAKHVFYSSENSKFRCRYDYYWTSVFKVEYTDHSLGQMQLALTEAPNEALPVSCRPDFGVAWLTKDKFKVNETYDCWYISGTPTVKLYNDGFFSCQAKDPSLIEMMKRYLILLDLQQQMKKGFAHKFEVWWLERCRNLFSGNLCIVEESVLLFHVLINAGFLNLNIGCHDTIRSIKILKSWFSSEGYARYWRSEVIAGIVTGFSTSIITISFIRTLQHMKSWLPQAINTVHKKRVCFLLVYFSVMGWLASHYWRRLSIPFIKAFNY